MVNKKDRRVELYSLLNRKNKQIFYQQIKQIKICIKFTAFSYINNTMAWYTTQRKWNRCRAGPSAFNHVQRRGRSVRFAVYKIYSLLCMNSIPVFFFYIFFFRYFHLSKNQNFIIKQNAV